MRKVLSETWAIFTQSVKEQDDPGQRLLMLAVFFIIASVMLFGAAGICFGFVKGVLEIIADTITTCAIGELPVIK